MKYQNILAPQTAFEQVKAHAAYLKNNGREFVYDSGYKLLTGDESAGNKDTTLAPTAPTAQGSFLRPPARLSICRGGI